MNVSCDDHKKAHKTFCWQNVEFMNVRVRQECYVGDTQFFLNKLQHGPNIRVYKQKRSTGQIGYHIAERNVLPLCTYKACHKMNA